MHWLHVRYVSPTSCTILYPHYIVTTVLCATEWVSESGNDSVLAYRSHVATLGSSLDCSPTEILASLSLGL